jgi:hypothetical protein
MQARGDTRKIDCWELEPSPQKSEGVHETESGMGRKHVRSGGNCQWNSGDEVKVDSGDEMRSGDEGNIDKRKK